MYQAYYDLLNVRQHSEFEKALRKLLFLPEERKAFYQGLLALDNDVSKDTFRGYFELYAAERKSNMQDYTPDSVSKILAQLSRREDEMPSGYSGYDPTAGTGSLLIQKWWDDMTQESIFSYAPHRYLYLAEELGDNAIPYLLHNLAIRGMNAIVIHGNTLERTAKQIYFVQNSKDDFLGFSDINVMPHSNDVEEWFDIKSWEEEAINYIESGEVVWQFALPMRKKRKTLPKPPTFETFSPWLELPKLSDVAEVERAKAGKSYPRGTVVIQMSATRGQVGLLESDGEVGSQYATVVFDNYINPLFGYYLLKEAVPNWFARIQEGLNVKIQDIESMPFGITEFRPVKKPIKYGQLDLFDFV